MSNVEELYKELQERYSATREYYAWLKRLSRTEQTYSQWRSEVVEKITLPVHGSEQHLAILNAVTIGQLEQLQLEDDYPISNAANDMIGFLKDRTITPFINYRIDSDTETAVIATYEPIIPGSATRPTFVIPGIELSPRFKNLIINPLHSDLAVGSSMVTATRLNQLAGV